MRCPLFISIVLLAGSKVDMIDLECTKSLCAWWDEVHGRCAITTIAVQLGFARADLKGIAKELTLIRPRGK